MKIMIINPNSSLEMTAHLDRVLNKIKGEHMELTVTCPPNGPLAIESSYDEAMCAPGVLELVKKANEEKYDAVILACFSDPALEQAREISDILVTGIEEISLHVAAMLGSKFTVLTMTDKRVPSKEAHVRRFKLEGSLASVRPLGMSVAEIEADEKRACAQILKVAKEAAEKDGAEVIVLGCAGMAGYADVVRSDLGMEVIDPSSLALKVTEALVAAGMKQSKRGYYSYPPCMCR